MVTHLELTKTADDKKRLFSEDPTRHHFHHLQWFNQAVAFWGAGSVTDGQSRIVQLS